MRAPLEGLRDIWAMLDLLDEHGEAVEFDLIALGLRLRNVGTDDFTWRDLKVVIQQSDASTALFRSLNPDEHHWVLGNLLLAEVADQLAVANWQRSGGSKRDYPKPIPRPGVTPDEVTYGKGALPLDEMAEWLGWK